MIPTLNLGMDLGWLRAFVARLWPWGLTGLVCWGLGLLGFDDAIGIVLSRSINGFGVSGLGFQFSI